MAFVYLWVVNDGTSYRRNDIEQIWCSLENIGLDKIILECIYIQQKELIKELETGFLNHLYKKLIE